MDFKIIIYALLIFLGLSAKSYSRIGETKNECIKRYGAVIGSDKEAGIQIHMKGGFSIAIQFVDNFVGSIAFQKMKEDILGQHEEISDNEIEIILNRNGGGKSWTENEQLSLDRLWTTEDGTLIAKYDWVEKILAIMTMEMVDLVTKSKKTSEAEKLDDF